MIQLSAAEVAHAVSGTLVKSSDNEALVVGSCQIDSRKVCPGDLFIAIRGENHDGHDHIEAALAAGAVAAISEVDGDGPRIVVADTVAALGALAEHVLSACADVTVLAVTGSSGKTSTKDILGQILESAGSTVWPEGSFNNELGLPLTALRIDSQTRFLVLEMGARGEGHIAALCKIAQPDIGLVLNVGSAHVGEFGSKERTAIAKGELIEALSADGTAVLNSDDPHVAAMAARTRAPVRTFGSGADAAVQVMDVVLDELARPVVTLRIDSEVRTVKLRLHGEHQAINAAAAAAAATAAGVETSAVFEALAHVYPQSRWRMEVTETADSTTVVNDAYNANPESMTAALRALVAMGRKKTTWAVLGEMRELGDDSILAHDDIGRQAVRLGVDHLVGVGAQTRPMVLGAASEGYYGGEAHFSPDLADARDYLAEHVGPGDVVLVKASRAGGLEVLATDLIADHGGPRDESAGGST
ncbi:MAG: UDP-N-acetylmuramoyl-tripeptide--D-alanyl-D-alanine ligase [Candidatus Nanopelagicales bacterium]